MAIFYEHGDLCTTIADMMACEDLTPERVMAARDMSCFERGGMIMCYVNGWAALQACPSAMD